VIRESSSKWIEAEEECALGGTNKIPALSRGLPSRMCIQRAIRLPLPRSLLSSRRSGLFRPRSRFSLCRLIVARANHHVLVVTQKTRASPLLTVIPPVAVKATSAVFHPSVSFKTATTAERNGECSRQTASFDFI